MFANQLRAAITAAPRVELGRLSETLWKAWGQGLLSDADAQSIADMIEARRALSVLPPRPRLRVGSRPRSPGHLERRRRWAASGCLPPALAARFTLAETAVLAVIAAEALRHGRCTLVIEHIAALAGVGRSTVKRALQAAQGLRLVRIEERRVSAWRNAPNIITIVSREWGAWLRMRQRGVGSKQEPPRLQENNKGASTLWKRAWAAKGQG